MIYKLRLPLHLQPLRQPQHEHYTRTRMLKLWDYETRNTLSVGSCRTFKPGTSTIGNFSSEEDGRVQKRICPRAGGTKREFLRRRIPYKNKRVSGGERRATAPAETAPAPSAGIGMFMPSTAPELRSRQNMAMFLQRFYTWASVAGCDSALDSDVTTKLLEPRALNSRDYTIARWYKNHFKCDNFLQRCLAKES